MAKAELKEIKTYSIQLTLTVDEAEDLQNILYNKVDDYNFDDSERVTSAKIKREVSEALTKFREVN